MEIRTDLALELVGEPRADGKMPSGVRIYEEKRHGQRATVVEITGKQGEKRLGKPRGKYITIEVENVLQRRPESFASAVSCVSGYIRELMKYGAHLPVLVAGLGNREITPDAVGPLTADHILVTRHMVRSMPEMFGSFRPVASVVPGVLGTTGLESAETVRALVKRTEAAGVIAVDAIAARDTGRLCSNIQISDTGIFPGSGIGNHREALTEGTLGVPVVAVGVPTVTDAATLVLDLVGEAHILEKQQEKAAGNMIVTCSDIDRRVREIARVLAYGINSALQPGLSLEDLSDLTY